jgi:hypothetical protein
MDGECENSQFLFLLCHGRAPWYGARKHGAKGPEVVVGGKEEKTCPLLALPAGMARKGPKQWSGTCIHAGISLAF